MIIRTKVRNHPLRFLLYTEWILLGLVGFTEVLPLKFLEIPRRLLLNLVCLALFGIMGLRLPDKQLLHQLVYTGLEFGLILLVSMAGGIHLPALLYLIVAIRNCFIFNQRQRIGVTGIAFTLFILTQAYRVQNISLPLTLSPERSRLILLSFALLFGLVLIFLQLMVDAVLSERRSQEELEGVNAQLRQYALRIEDIATLQERNRIAREIHDSLGHSLTAFNLHLEAALRLLPSEPAEATELLKEAKQLGATVLKEVRQSVATLRSDPLQGKSLSETIAGLIDDFQRSTGISPKSQLALSRPIPPDVKIATYRILQEALTNICKYAEATDVTIQIQATTFLQLMIQDNGKGFNLDQNTTGFGLQGMRERARALGGSIEILTAPSQGCKIVVSFPLAKWITK